MNQVNCGLFTTMKTEIALLGVEIDVVIKGLHSHVSLKQHYQNQEEFPIEATYLFPIQDGAATFGFKALSEGKELIGKVLEREDAFDVYDDAITEGHSAYLMDYEREDVFHCSIGNLAPQQAVTIEISYVRALEHVEGKSRFLLPTVVAPKYVPSSQIKQVGKSEQELWNAPRISSAPYTFNLNIKLFDLGEVISIESPSHPIKTRMQKQQVEVELAQRTNTLDRDFILEFELESVNQAFKVQTEQGSYVSVHYHAPVQTEAERSPKEVIVLLDVSGSMMGQELIEAKRAISLLLRGLEEHDYFNIYYFESNFHKHWPRSKPYTQANLDDLLVGLEAAGSMGGTEIFSPLQAILNLPQIDGLERKVILLTDGEVSNDDEVIRLCRQHQDKAMIFSFGIGNMVGKHLVSSVAKVTRGSAEFIHSGERIEPKVLRVLRKLGEAQQILKVDWGQHLVPCKTNASAVFGGESLILYAKAQPKLDLPSELQLSIDGQALNLPLKQANLDQSHITEALPLLWAKTEITRLEEKIKGDVGSLQTRRRSKDKQAERDQSLKAEIIALAIKYQLMSKFTSFVVVDERLPGQEQIVGMKLRPVPLINRSHSYVGSIGSLSSAPNNMVYPYARILSPDYLQGSAAPAKSQRRSSNEGDLISKFIPDMFASFIRPSKSDKKKTSGGGQGDRPRELQSRAAPSSSRNDSSDFELYASSPLKKSSVPQFLFEESPFIEPSSSAKQQFIDVESQSMMSISEDSLIDQLFQILGAQQADGSFAWNDQLVGLLSAQTQRELAQLSQLTPVMFTRLIIRELETNFREHQDLYSIAIKKAKNYVNI